MNPLDDYVYMMLSGVKCHDAMSSLSCLLLVIVIYVSLNDVRLQITLCAQLTMLVHWRLLGIDKHHRVDRVASEIGTFRKRTLDLHEPGMCL